MFKKLKYYLNEIASVKYRMDELRNEVLTLQHELGLIKGLLSNDLKSSKINLGQIQNQLNIQKAEVSNLADVEFQVFSQFGDDGIIQYLTNKIEIPNKTFIEFGVENYSESNTRFLLYNNSWTGYVIDGSPDNVAYINADLQNWTSELYTECAFINAENINGLLAIPGFDPEIGILSIDVDGNDYWLWEAINTINPIIVVIEYNSLFGKNTTWSIPYDASFARREKHFSLLYFGASLKALQLLGEKKGYSLIGSNSKGNNAYFLRNDKLGSFKTKTAEEAYVYSKFRETVINGERVSGIERTKLIEGLDVIDTRTGLKSEIHLSKIQY